MNNETQQRLTWVKLYEETHDAGLVCCRTRYRVLRIYSRRTAANTLDFLDQVVDEMPFPIQTDRGREFFAEKVQQRMEEFGIKFRPNKPASPHLTGKVERSQKTDKTEFYSTVNIDSECLHDLLA